MPSPTAAPSNPLSPAPVPETLLPLSQAPVGWRRVVTRVDGPDRSELEREGLLPGSTVVVGARTPLGGPLIVEVGRARLALSAQVAGQVSTRAFTPLDKPLP
jgi:Fe2+ transport system protein FeoA